MRFPILPALVASRLATPAVTADFSAHGLICVCLVFKVEISKRQPVCGTVTAVKETRLKSRVCGGRRSVIVSVSLGLTQTEKTAIIGRLTVTLLAIKDLRLLVSRRGVVCGRVAC